MEAWKPSIFSTKLAYFATAIIIVATKIPTAAPAAAAAMHFE
jgi:hypothetical protein